MYLRIHKEYNKNTQEYILYSCISFEYNPRHIRIRLEYDRIRVEYSILRNTEEYKRNTRGIHRIPY